MHEIEFFRLKNGKCPIIDFLDDQPGNVAQKITWVLKLIEESDKIPKSFFKKLVNSDNIYECRIIVGNNTYRILAFLDVGNKIILTHGFQKKSQKTPKNEIVKAEKYKKEYLSTKRK